MPAIIMNDYNLAINLEPLFAHHTTRESMSIYAPGTPTYKKVIGYVGMALLALSLVGVLTSTLINDQLYAILSIGAALISAVIVILMLWLMRDEQSELSLHIKEMRHKRWKAILCIVIVIPLFLQISLAKGLPVVIHHLISDEAIILNSVKETRHGYKNKGPDGCVYINGYRFWYNNFICGLTEEDWYEVKPDDVLVLKGSKSAIGFSYQGYKKLTSSLLQQTIAERLKQQGYKALTLKEAQALVSQ
ncbi:hypothetical protein VSF3289_01404 [Vibrio scophthalmi]|uniref:Uncharacterized protein n=2 Tax=Vibrio scophthalmi TaxID=45658 RepID=A0A1E3WMY1_9VIBR|nr:hypothetical protein VSF3289_01404 [Vibrio scophthalmi]